MTATLIDPQARVSEAVRKVGAIATLPEVTAKIVATVEDPKSTASALHKIVAHDPALVTRILKVVNSSFYGLPGQIASVERAIVLLGLNAVKNLAVAASLGQMFRGVKLCEGFTARDLWTHCIAVAVTARELARQMKAPVAEEAFLSGMIHDVGLLVALQVWPDQLRQACEAAGQGEDFCQAEQRISGVDHQQLGAGLAELWKFPRLCQRVAGYHHRPTALAEDGRLLVSLVYAADTICAQAGKGFPLTAHRQDIGTVGLDSELLRQTVAKLDQLLGVASTLLGG